MVPVPRNKNITDTELSKLIQVNIKKCQSAKKFGKSKIRLVFKKRVDKFPIIFIVNS